MDLINKHILSKSNEREDGHVVGHAYDGDHPKTGGKVHDVCETHHFVRLVLFTIENALRSLVHVGQNQRAHERHDCCQGS